MGYTKDIYQRAYQILEERRATAERTAQQRREELYGALPQLSELERSLARTGMAAVQAALSGQDAAAQIEQLRRKNLALQEQRASLLKEAGLSPDFLAEQYTCMACKDTGTVGHRQCSCLTELLRKLAYEKLSSSSGIQDCSFENFSLDYYPNKPSGKYNIVPRQAMERVYSICLDYALHFKERRRNESLLLLGGTGLGKTHLSLAIAREVTRQGAGVVYTSSHRLLDKLQAQQFSRGGATDETDYQQLALECDLLLVDDLGAEFSTTFTVAALYGIINSRINENRPTVISTNFDETVLKERYGDRILSRLLCTYHPLQFYGEDIRMLKRIYAK